MKEHSERDDRVEARDPGPASRIETIGRVLFLFGGGLLLSILVSCACGPTR
jgi:hypothetical protein